MCRPRRAPQPASQAPPPSKPATSPLAVLGGSIMCRAYRVIALVGVFALAISAARSQDRARCERRLDCGREHAAARDGRCACRAASPAPAGRPGAGGGAIARRAPVRAPSAALPSLGTQLDEPTVTSTKTEAPVIDTLGGATVISRDQIDAIQPDRVSDLLRQTPGVTTLGEPQRSGQAINIRGPAGFRPRQRPGRRSPPELPVDRPRRPTAPSISTRSSSVASTSREARSPRSTGPERSAVWSRSAREAWRTSSSPTSASASSRRLVAAPTATASSTRPRRACACPTTPRRPSASSCSAKTTSIVTARTAHPGYRDRAQGRQRQAVGEPGGWPPAHRDALIQKFDFTNNGTSSVGTRFRSALDTDTYTLGYRYTPPDMPLIDLSIKGYYSTTFDLRTLLNPTTTYSQLGAGRATRSAST